jgi:hypothetical protein
VGTNGYTAAWDPNNFPVYGSYGINGWMYNPPPASGVPDANFYWRKLSAAYPGHNVPLFGDCNYDGSTPDATNTVPSVKNQQIEGTMGDMSNWCITRHDSQRPLDISFVDSSVTTVGLRQLWRLNWHVNMNTSYADAMAQWPKWIRSYQ